MVWARLDDSSADHPKVLAAGNAAWGAFCRMLAWSNRYLTDGKLPPSLVAQFAPDGEVERLLSCGLLEQDGPDLVIHDFLEYNPSGEQVRAERSKAAERMAGVRAKFGRTRVRSSHAPDPDPDPDPRTPEEQIQTPPGPPVGGGPASPKAKRASRLPLDWQPDPADTSRLAAELRMSADAIKREQDNFRDYWAAAAGKGATKMDWKAAWRGWLRRSSEFKGPTNGRGTGKRPMFACESAPIIAQMALDAERDGR